MATVEELSEREVMWPEARHDAPAIALGSSSPLLTPAPRVSREQQQPPCPASSRPVDIPRAARWPRAGRTHQLDEVEDDEEVDGQDGGCCGDMVPPHVMVSRRRSEVDGETAVAFSLRSGPGRARRDLSHLRNSVLRMTGSLKDDKADPSFVRMCTD